MGEGIRTGTVLGIRHGENGGKIERPGKGKIIHVGHFRDNPETWDGTGSWDNIECPWLRPQQMGIIRGSSHLL